MVLQPFIVVVNVNLNDVLQPELAVTDTFCEVVLPTIVPFPVMLHKYEVLLGAEYIFEVEVGHTVSLPVIEHTGFGFTVTVTLNELPVHVPDFGVTLYTTFIGAFVELVRVPLMFVAFVPAVVPEIPVTIRSSPSISSSGRNNF